MARSRTRSTPEPTFANSLLEDAEPGTRCHICPNTFRVKMYPKKDGTTPPTCWACIRGLGDPRRGPRES